MENTKLRKAALHHMLWLAANMGPSFMDQHGATDAEISAWKDAPEEKRSVEKFWHVWSDKLKISFANHNFGAWHAFQKYENWTEMLSHFANAMVKFADIGPVLQTIVMDRYFPRVASNVREGRPMNLHINRLNDRPMSSMIGLMSSDAHRNWAILLSSIPM